MLKGWCDFTFLLVIMCVWPGVCPGVTEETTNVSDNTGISESPDVAAAQHSVYVVWNDNTSGLSLVYWSQHDGSWSPASAVSATVGGCCARIAIDSECVWVVWQGSDAIYSSQHEDGWSEAAQVPDSVGGTAPDVSVEATTAYVVWEESDDIYFASYNDGWSPAVKVSNSTNAAGQPRIAAKDGTVHVVWHEIVTYTPLVCDIHYARHDEEWSEPLNISNSDSDSGRPAVAVVGDVVHVVWDDDVLSPAADIFYSFYDGSWSAPANISSSSGGSLSPAVFADQSAVHVAWYEYVLGVDTFDIMYASRSHALWSQPENISSSLGWAWFPQISCDGDGFCFVAWSDNTPSNFDIFVAIHSTGGIFRDGFELGNTSAWTTAVGQ